MIDVSELITDPEFTSVIQYKTTTTTLADEGEVSVSEGAPQNLDVVILPANEDDYVEFAYEGDRTKRGCVVYTEIELKISDDNTIGDIVVWHDLEYRIVKRKDFSDQGYYASLGVAIKKAP